MHEDHHIDHHKDPTKNLYPKSSILKKDNRVAEQVQPTLSLSFDDYMGKNQYLLDGDKAKAIAYFLTKFERNLKDEHPRLKANQWKKVIDDLFCIEGDDGVIDLDECKALIDKYFKKTYQAGCNYSLIHFNTYGVKKNLYYEELY